MLIQNLPVATSVAQLLSLTFSGVTFLTVIAAAWKLSALLATMTTELKALVPLGEKVVILERDVALMKKDMNNLWQAHREYCDRKDREAERIAEFLEEWDRKHA